jgi:WD40 repeat protein
MRRNTSVISSSLVRSSFSPHRSLLTYLTLIAGSDDGSILLWNLNPPSHRTHHIHGKRRSVSQRSGSLTQSPPSLASNSLISDPDLNQIPLLPPPILPLAQLVEGRKSGKPHRWRKSEPFILVTSSSSLNRRFHGAGAELYCLSTSPPTSTLADRCVSPPRDSATDAANSDLSPSSMRAIPQVIRPVAPSLFRSNFHGHGGPIWAVDYDEENNQLFSGSYDQTIKVKADPPCSQPSSSLADLGCRYWTVSPYTERAYRLDLFPLCPSKRRNFNCWF